MFGVRLWGVRGSIPSPGPHTVKYGGNTSCIQIITDLDYEIMVDFGTGARALGNHYFSNPNIKKPLKIHSFLSHTHWDHIYGFPFFGPIYAPTSEIDIYGPVSLDGSLAEIVGGQLNYEHFPVNFTQLQSKITYHELKEGSLELDGGVKVSYIYLNHPVLCLGYRFEYQGKSICTCYDHEPYTNVFANDPDNFQEGLEASEESNKRVVDFFHNADILIHDSQYTTREYPKFAGWGHSTYKYSIDQAAKAGVKTLLLTHHDPERSDEKLDILKKLCDRNYNSKNGLKVYPAYEGLEILL